MTNMKIIIEVEKNFLEITNADTATASAAVRSFCNMLKTKSATATPSSSKIIVQAKKEELPENPDDRIPVKATRFEPANPAIEPPKTTPPTQHTLPTVANPGRPLTESELRNLKHAMKNREKMTTLPNGNVGVIETIRFTNTEPSFPTYRSKYVCPTCGHTGTRFVRETNTYLKCHKCESQLTLEKLVPGTEYMESSEEGFFFEASRLASYHNAAQPIKLPQFEF